MRKDWKYIVYVGGALLLFLIIRLISPRQFDWTVTYAYDDKNPFGGYALYELLPSLFDEIDHHYQPVYEIKDSIRTDDNIFIIASDFSGDKADTEALMDHVERGGNVFISAEYFWGHFSDTLKFNTYDQLVTDVNAATPDSTYLKFSTTKLDTSQQFWFAKGNVSHFFERFDTLNTTIISENAAGKPVTVRIKHGTGSFILNSTPHAFTNIYLLSHDNHEFVSSTLSFLPKHKLSWSEYYQLGRMESKSPLRFILNSEPLAWAYYLSIAGVVIFMLFEGKRKQRIIPVMKPLANTSLEFVTTIGNLYFQRADHKNIAEKKIAYLLDVIRSKYLLKTSNFDDDFYEHLSRKSGKPANEVRALFRLIIFVTSSTVISENQLMDLNDKIEKFLKE